MKVKTIAWNASGTAREAVTDTTVPVTITVVLPGEGTQEIHAEMVEARLAATPKGWHRYCLRGSDDDPNGEPATIEDHVGVNHYADILVRKPLCIPECGYLEITDFRID